MYYGSEYLLETVSKFRTYGVTFLLFHFGINNRIVGKGWCIL